MIKNAIDYQDYVSIAKEFELFNSVFQSFWELGKPRFTDLIDTAAVRFDKEGNCIDFLFNPNYYESLNRKQVAFVVAHECLHVILNHGFRISDSKHNQKINNIAADIVVNHLLTDKFGFNRKEIDPDDNYCWIDTIFPNDENVLYDKNMEYYIGILKKKSNQASSNFSIPSKSLVDDHSELSDIPADFIIDELSKSQLSDEDKAKFVDSVKGQIEDSNQSEHVAGNQCGNLIKWMDTITKVPQKRKWETVIKKWYSKQKREDSFETEQWIRSPRRIMNLPQDIILPYEMEIEEKCEEKNKIDIFFFLDTSGSCINLAPRFWKAAKSLPKERFNINLFCFDTDVYPVNLKDGELYGFGGTFFSVLEKYIQHTLKKGELKEYPMAIFVITDGHGDTINPLYPKRWHWFLTKGGTKRYINEKCNVYNLENFE